LTVDEAHLYAARRMAEEFIFEVAGAGGACASILAELPQWFGRPESNAAYAALAQEGLSFVALADGEAEAVMLLKHHGGDATEIYLLAVSPALHRGGLGRALVERACAIAAARDARYVTAKTLGPSADYEPYEGTRTFWRAMGFVALEEFTEIWGPGSPALFMVRRLDAPVRSPRSG
jgi:ribosomal protein S18 acetylase RimI-like enzyme